MLKSIDEVAEQVKSSSGGRRLFTNKKGVYWTVPSVCAARGFHFYRSWHPCSRSANSSGVERLRLTRECAKKQKIGGEHGLVSGSNATTGSY